MSCSIPGLEGAPTGLDQNMLQKNKLKQTQSGVNDLKKLCFLKNSDTENCVAALSPTNEHTM